MMIIIIIIIKPVNEIPHNGGVRMKRGAVVENQRAAGRQGGHLLYLSFNTFDYHRDHWDYHGHHYWKTQVVALFDHNDDQGQDHDDHVCSRSC